MLRIPVEYDTDTALAKFKAISLQLPASLLGVCYNQIALVDESGVIRTKMRTHSRSENGRSAWNALYSTTPVAVTSNVMLESSDQDGNLLWAVANTVI
jgi:hypothetical protein